MVWSPTQVEAQLDITLALSDIEPLTNEAVITEASMDTVDFSSAVTVEIPPYFPYNVVVSLVATTSTGWNTSIDPKKIEFNESGTRPVNVSVVVPQDTNIKQVGTVTVKATATYPGSSKSVQSSATLTVRQFFRWTARVDIGYPKRTTDTVYFSVTIYNLGNGDDVFLVELLDKDALDAYDIHVELDKSTTELIPPHHSDRIHAELRYEGDERPHLVHLDFRVTSTAAVKAGYVPSYTEIDGGIVFEPNPSFVEFLEHPLRDTTSQNYIILVAIITIVIAVVVSAFLIYRLKKKRVMKLKKGQKKGHHI